MKKQISLLILLICWVFPNLGKAQLIGFDSTATNMGSLPDTINLDDILPHRIVIMNFDAGVYSGDIHLVSAIDSSGTLISIDTVGTIFVSNFGNSDTVSVQFTETYSNSNGYKVGDNIVVVWPVAGTSAIKDTIRQNVYIAYPNSTQDLENSNEYSFFPNPFSSKITLIGLNNSDDISIMDITGKIIYRSEAYFNPLVLNTEEWRKGLYFLRVTNSKKSTLIKIVKH